MRKLLVYLLFAMKVDFTKAQDPQFSQFYAAPMYLNPGFAGTTVDNRIVFNHRIQWPSLPGAFVTSNFCDWNR